MPIVFGVVVVIFIMGSIYGAIQARKRREGLFELAQRLNLDFDAGRDCKIPERFNFFKQFTQGSDRYAANVLSGNYQQNEILAFDYHYTTSSGKNRQDHNLSFFILIMQGGLFPQLTIRPEGFFDRVAETLGFQDIKFESAEFSKAFCVRSPDKKFAYLLAQYNALVALKNYIRESWSDVDVELKRGYDLIPNLVATVKGYATHEREVFERVTELRNRCAANNGAVADQSRDEVQLVAALKQLLVVVENYPQLKADQNFLKLQTELVNTEDRIQAARRFYNGNVRDYRNKCETFPSNLVANMFGFKSEGDLFSVPPSVRDVPNVDFATM
jgi:LemA protein